MDRNQFIAVTASMIAFGWVFFWFYQAARIGFETDNLWRVLFSFVVTGCGGAFAFLYLVTRVFNL